MSSIPNVSCCPLDVMYGTERLSRQGSSPPGWRSGRRFSSGASLLQATSPSSTANGPSGSPNGGLPQARNATKRRLSQVGAVVTRRLSTTIGWGNLAQWSSSVIATEAKGLCAQYIRARFRRSAIFHRKLGLQRLRSVVNMTTSYGGAGETFHYLNMLGKDLESRHPKVYESVCRQICRTLTEERIVRDVFFTLASAIIPKEEAITLGRIVALFAMAGGLAVDCVQQGHVDYVLCIIEYFGAFVEREMAPWITQQGGWGFLVTKCKPNCCRSFNLFNATTYIGIPCLIALLLYIPLCSLSLLNC